MTFLVTALLAALLGFAELAGSAASIAKLLSAICAVVFFLTVTSGRKHT